MCSRPLGSTGVQVAEIGQGTWGMELDRSSSVAALRKGLDLGMTHIDTAEMYGDGEVEKIVGEALDGRREEAFLVSKVLPTHASRTGTIQACEGSLERLSTEFLDCYLLHWPGEFPLEDTFAAFEELLSSGKIRSWGVSNFDERLLSRAVRNAGRGRIACNQVLYHLEERRIEHSVLPACLQHGIALVAYSPFGSGRFPTPGTRGGRVLATIAARHGATPRQVALAFLLSREGLLVIPKSSDPEHVVENAGATGLALEPEEIRSIQDAFPAGRPRSGWVPTL